MCEVNIHIFYFFVSGNEVALRQKSPLSSVHSCLEAPGRVPIYLLYFFTFNSYSPFAVISSDAQHM